MKKNKLNKKGFTLIELLAVIVILAIILVATVPAFMGVIDDAKKSSISNLSKSVAESYNGSLAQDLLSPGATLHGIDGLLKDEWQCIGDLTATDGGTTYNLANILELSEKDLILKSSEGVSAPTVVAVNEKKLSKNNCSSIRKKSNGSAEILLIAASDGNFDITGKTVFALSTADTGEVLTPTTPSRPTE